MAIELIDGTGSGRKVGVSPTGGRLNVSSRSDQRIYYISRDDGQSYVWAPPTYNGAAADTVLLVKNNGVIPLYIHEIWLSSDVDTRWVIHLPTTNVTVAGAATIVGVNLNTGSNNVADAVAEQAETGNSQGNIIWSGETQAAANPLLVEFGDALSLHKNKSIGIDIVGEPAIVDVSITGFFDND